MPPIMQNMVQHMLHSTLGKRQLCMEMLIMQRINASFSYVPSGMHVRCIPDIGHTK